MFLWYIHTFGAAASAAARAEFLRAILCMDGQQEKVVRKKSGWPVNNFSWSFGVSNFLSVPPQF